MEKSKNIQQAFSDADKCPRCDSTRIYTTETDFICLTCSYIVKQEK